ncbi:Ribosome maturation factor rimM [Emticicia oligotrophica DSM 17448]|uniref:Ribosome maturation factor RimM n=1 Tax=Emticicia oligotrophica (strain DSM 17448 / CIP 109782 / MTCC 6937 / GPTSA100-15) TaxID=929562 RepID=A0ABM5N7A5_EMTOG|nr:ribosome maturation factor RimM [Emticicia oligotrophica]AFK05338.1 Ribosome maturation factor rimM [Emticicia oligotrophica DSM 17448]
MTKEDCYLLGRLTKTHGLKGELTIWLDVDYPEEYEDLDSVLVEIKGELVPHFVEEIQIRPNKSIIKFEDINSIEAAQKIVNCDLYLPNDNLEELDDDQFYYHEIIDFDIVDDSYGKLGRVSAVYTAEVQDLIAMVYQNKEILIPISDEIVKTVDRDKKELYTSLPQGLLEVYLEEGNELPDDADEDEQ